MSLTRWISVKRLPAHQVTLVYMDPPWGGTFIFKETSATRSKAISSRRDSRKEFHTLLAELAQQAHRILTDQGTLFWRLPRNRVSDVHLIINQVFESLPWAEITVPTRQRNDRISSLEPGTETWLVYSRSQEPQWNPVYTQISDNDLEQRFPHRDEHGAYRLESTIRSADRPALQFEWRGYRPSEHQSWIRSRSELDQLAEAGQIVFGATWPRRKRYFKHDAENMRISANWADLQVDKGISSGCFPPKSVIDRILHAATNPGESVVEPYCRCATLPGAAHAMNRRWLVCSPASEDVSRLQMQLDREHGAICARDYLCFAAAQSVQFIVLSPSMPLPVTEVRAIRDLQIQAEQLLRSLQLIKERLIGLEVSDESLLFLLDELIQDFIDHAYLDLQKYEVRVRQWIAEPELLHRNSFTFLVQAEFFYVQLSALGATDFSPFVHQYSSRR